MKVYGANLSPFVRKVLAVCAVKGLDYEHEVVMPGSDDPAYREISPLGKIPGFEDGDLRVSDSSVICEYLEETYPEVAMLPADPALRARSRWYEEYADSKFVEALGPFFFERFFKKIAGLGEPDEERLKQVAEEVAPEMLAYVESQVPAEGYLFGDSIGIADIALVSPMINGEYGGYEIDAGLYPRTAAYRDRVKAHPAVAATPAADKAMMEAMAA